MNYKNLDNQENLIEFKLKIEQYLDNGLINKAITILKEAIKSYSDNPVLYYLMGKSYYIIEDYDRALQYIKQAIYYDKSNDKYLAFIGTLLYYFNDFKDSYNYSNKSLEINPDNIQAIVNLGMLKFKEGKYEESTKYVKKALKLDENYFHAIRLLSKIYMNNATDIDLTLTTLRKAKRLSYDETIDIDIIKVLYIEQLFDECQKECKKILINKPNSSAAQEARRMLSKLNSIKAQEKTRSQANKDYDLDKSKKREGPDSLEESLDELNSLIGLENVKLEVEKIVRSIQFEKNRAKILGLDKNYTQYYHFTFEGNPGTGKTTVARLIGNIFYHLGILESGHTIECDRSSIVGQFIGQTAILTKETIEKAMGGVLFVDEAYSLAREGSSNDFGQEAIETLLKAMEDSRDKFTVILAGYTDEMRNLLRSNPGFKSRVNKRIEFEDFNETALLEVAKHIAAENHYKLSKESEQVFIDKIKSVQLDNTFANARTVRNIIEEAVREKGFRIGDKEVNSEELSTLYPEDFGVILEDDNEDIMNNLLEELNKMTGLEEVKIEINKILDFVKLQHKKKERGYEVDNISVNMIFTGNPGTGKTTVARLVSKIFSEMGILKKGHLVEVTRDDLVGRYIGQTGHKTLDKINEAYGGVLFIDEAYSLNSRSESDFGKEAISTLIKEMEDNRDKLGVIMAGYTNEMIELIDMNPGIKSRVDYTIDFPDYRPAELLEIFKGFCLKENYNLCLDAEDILIDIFQDCYDNRDKNFGNARLVRQYFEQIKMQQAGRLSKSEFNDEDMFTIIEEDIMGFHLSI